MSLKGQFAAIFFIAFAAFVLSLVVVTLIEPSLIPGAIEDIGESHFYLFWGAFAASSTIVGIVSAYRLWVPSKTSSIFWERATSIRLLGMSTGLALICICIMLIGPLP